ncbi:MAG: hypothetical protein LC790_06545, partial [Actinobacteria bacterium]|nr:hypothetical protein [Actinomycetota bacterium]
TKQLGCGRRLDKFPQITTRLTGMVDRFTSMLDCVEIGFSRVSGFSGSDRAVVIFGAWSAGDAGLGV